MLSIRHTHKELASTMKIQSVRIKNFRTLKDVTIPFDSVTTFIGPNGAGKSTVLRALDWFFNGKPGSLTEKDCSFGATDEEIEVQVAFADLTIRIGISLASTRRQGSQHSLRGSVAAQTGLKAYRRTRRATRRSTPSAARDRLLTRRQLTTICGPQIRRLASRPGAIWILPTKL